MLNHLGLGHRSMEQYFFSVFLVTLLFQKHRSQDHRLSLFSSARLSRRPVGPGWAECLSSASVKVQFGLTEILEGVNWRHMLMRKNIIFFLPKIPHSPSILSPRNAAFPTPTRNKQPTKIVPSISVRIMALWKQRILLNKYYPLPACGILNLPQGILEAVQLRVCL